MTWKAAVTLASVLVQAVAAALWFWSAWTGVTSNSNEQAVRDAEGEDAWLAGGASVDGIDIGLTVMLAAKWNRWAAAATGLGVGLQAVANALPDK